MPCGKLGYEPRQSEVFEPNYRVALIEVPTMCDNTLPRLAAEPTMSVVVAKKQQKNGSNELSHDACILLFGLQGYCRKASSSPS
ncbi:hypothetical protein L7F22_067265 [Adiantum nelumboides]|nr:hypothetical protein [Adiantum nelumboides]